MFAKIPQAGKVKTRLTPFLNPEQAADLYAAFLQDTLQIYGTLSVDVRLYLADDSGSLPTHYLAPNTKVYFQKGADLGERMLHAFVESFMAGYQRLVIIGTDHPTLPPEFIEIAFEVLQEKQSITIGKSEDGGFYMLGMNDLYPQLFEEMTYSHDAVFEETLDRVAQTNAQLTLLPEWYDVDVPQDLMRLMNDLSESTLALPMTKALLPQLLALKKA